MFLYFCYPQNLINLEITGRFGDNNDLYTNDSIVTYNFYNSGPQIATITLVNDSNGCIANDTLILNLTHLLKIPGAVSANIDGFNDAFIIRALENYENNSLTIFNRWGDVVFEASPYLNDWAGQSKNGEVVDGTYFYVLSLTDQGEENIYKGSIELKRQ